MNTKLVELFKQLIEIFEDFTPRVTPHYLWHYSEPRFICNTACLHLSPEDAKMVVDYVESKLCDATVDYGTSYEPNFEVWYNHHNGVKANCMSRDYALRIHHARIAWMREIVDALSAV